MNLWKWIILWYGFAVLAFGFILGMLPDYDAGAVGQLAGLFGGWPYLIGCGFYLKSKHRSLWWLLLVLFLWPFSLLIFRLLRPKIKAKFEVNR